MMTARGDGQIASPQRKRRHVVVSSDDEDSDQAQQQRTPRRRLQRHRRSITEPAKPETDPSSERVLRRLERLSRHESSESGPEIESEPADDSGVVLVSDEEDDDIQMLSDVLKDEKKSEVYNRAGLRHFKCPICLEQPDVVGVTPCGKCGLSPHLLQTPELTSGHMYCNDCVFRALCSSDRATETRGECSICRRRVIYTQVRYLEFRRG